MSGISQFTPKYVAYKLKTLRLNKIEKANIMNEKSQFFSTNIFPKRTLFIVENFGK